MTPPAAIKPGDRVRVVFDPLELAGADTHAGKAWNEQRLFRGGIYTVLNVIASASPGCLVGLKEFPGVSWNWQRFERLQACPGREQPGARDQDCRI